MTIRTRRRDRPAGSMEALTDEQLVHLEGADGRPHQYRKPPLKELNQAPDPDWLEWGAEMKRRGLPFAAWGSFATEAEREARWAEDRARRDEQEARLRAEIARIGGDAA